MGERSGPDAAAPSRRRRARERRLDRLVPVGAFLLTLVLRLLRATVRVRTIDAAEVYACWRRGEQVILAFWHDRLALMPLVYAGPRACIMISHHRDGELIARAVEPLGIDTVRGSSTRGWSGALKAMLRAHQGGADLAFAADGPRGPRHVAKSGPVQVARATGARIFPVAGAARWCVRLGSWDRLVVPLPFSRAVYVAGAPIAVPHDADAAVVEAARHTLEERLARATADAEAAAAA
jgi:lysophospholipid acyltransferase (LPLAT)-like uncharacterized protein